MVAQLRDVVAQLRNIVPQFRDVMGQLVKATMRHQTEAAAAVLIINPG
jgi:hypothetical protein